MNKVRKPALGLMAAALFAVAGMAHAEVRITEVAPWSSGDSPIGADWFELTNTGVSAVDLAGWSMDDNSAIAGVAPLSGVSSIAAGSSAIFVEGDSTTTASFINTWFGGNAPAGFAIGTYSGKGVGLSTSGDAVNVFDAAGVLQASVSFGASTSGLSFDNAEGLDGGTISRLSAVGVNGAFAALGDATEIGSPGRVAAVPEPETYALMLAGLGLIGGIARKRRA